MKTTKKAINELAMELMLRDSQNGKFETKSFDFYYLIAKQELMGK